MILNYSLSFKELDKYIIEFNTKQETIATRIRQSMLGTAQQIIKIYGATLLDIQKEKPVDPEDLPLLSTNSEQLATMTHATARTIRRHVKRLLDSRILIEKKWHGSHHNYELFINPKLLWINGVGIVDKGASNLKTPQKMTSENQHITNSIGTKCPYSEPYKKTNKRNNTLIAVEKLQRQWQVNLQDDRNTIHKKTDKTLERSPLSLPNPESTKKKTKKETKKTRRKDPSKKGARRKDAWWEEAENDQKIAGKRQTAAQNFEVKPVDNCGYITPYQTSRHAFLSNYVEELWQLAKSTLYKDVWLCKRQSEVGISLLFQWYEPVPDNKLGYVHEVYKTRIRMARDYVDRDAEHRFIMLPEAYFDPKIKSGFAGTMSWYKADKRHRKTEQSKKVLREQIQKFRDNEKERNYKARPRLTVFKECEKRIIALQLPELLRAFYKAVLDPNSKTYQSCLSDRFKNLLKMKQQTRKSRVLLAEKLKKAVQDIQVDVFGYEAKTTKNILNYMERLSAETSLSREHLIVRIFQEDQYCRVGIYHGGRLVRRIPITELITLFTNTDPSGWPSMETKVEKGIQRFMNGFASDHGFGVEELHVCIHSRVDAVWVKGYRGINFVEDIPLKVLIKHFTG